LLLNVWRKLLPVSAPFLPAHPLKKGRPALAQIAPSDLGQAVAVPGAWRRVECAPAFGPLGRMIPAGRAGGDATLIPRPL